MKRDEGETIRDRRPNGTRSPNGTTCAFPVYARRKQTFVVRSSLDRRTVFVDETRTETIWARRNDRSRFDTSVFRQTSASPNTVYVGGTTRETS